VGMTEAREVRDCRVASLLAMTEGGEGIIRAYAIRPYWKEREY